MQAANPLREKDRNRLLRRADWRFLLPNPNPVKTITFTKGLLYEAVKLISTDMVDALHHPLEDCDLAVAVNPSPRTLLESWAALSPGSSCYTEWYSPMTGGPRRVRKRLQAAGFEDVTCYWPWPWPSLSNSRFWLPLEAPGARHYLLTGRPPARGALRRIGSQILRVLWLVCLRLGLTLPVCAIARKPAVSTCAQPGMGNRPLSTADRPWPAVNVDTDLREMIQTHWQKWGLGPTPKRLSALTLTGGPRSISKVVKLIFAESEGRPRLVAKMPRVPESVPGLIREAATLQAVEKLRRDGMPGAPRVLFCQEYVNLFTVGETAIIGQPIFALLTLDNYRTLALKAADWLAELAGESQPHPAATWWDRLIEPVLTDFAEAYKPILDSGMLRATRDILATLGALPLVCEQRDFGPWNVMITPAGGIGVVDWESSEVRGLPAMDLVYFLTYLTYFLDGTLRSDGTTGSGRFRESYRRTLDPTTLVGSLRAECLTRYANHLGLHVDALRPLPLLVWLLHCRSEYQQLSADVAGKPAPTALQRSLFVSLWDEELRSLSARSGGSR